MPNMDGYEFVAKVAELMGRNAPPVIVVTTESGEEFTRKVRRMGAKGYLKKPFTVQSMKKAVEPFLK